MPDYLATIYDEKNRPYTDYPTQMCKHLIDKYGIAEGARLLDFGCGRGDFTKAFKRLGLEVVGIDRERGNENLLEGIEVYISEDLENNSLPFPDNSFDVIFSKSVIEHFWKPDNFIQEVKRVLKPGGRVIIMTPDWQSQMNIFYIDYSHVHPYIPGALEDLFAMYGFRNAEAEIFYQLPILWKYPWLKIVSRTLQLFGPPKKIYKNKFIRWSRELMVLGSAVK